MAHQPATSIPTLRRKRRSALAALSKPLSINATCGNLISHNDNVADGHIFRVKLSYLF